MSSDHKKTTKSHRRHSRHHHSESIGSSDSSISPEVSFSDESSSVYTEEIEETNGSASTSGMEEDIDFLSDEDSSSSSGSYSPPPTRHRSRSNHREYEGARYKDLLRESRHIKKQLQQLKKKKKATPKKAKKHGEDRHRRHHHRHHKKTESPKKKTKKHASQKESKSKSPKKSTTTETVTTTTPPTTPKTPRNRKPRESRRESKKMPVIDVNDEAHVKLAKLVPPEVISRLDLKTISLEKLTHKMYKEDRRSFDRALAEGYAMLKSGLVVVTPADPNAKFGHLYLCKPVIITGSDKERMVVDKASDVLKEIKFRKLPDTFAKRNNVLELFNQHAPSDKKKETSKPSCKDKIVVRMNWLLSNGHGILSMPLAEHLCSEICILQDQQISDDDDDDDEEGDDDDARECKEVKVICVWQASTTRKYNLWCIEVGGDSEEDKIEPSPEAIADYLHSREQMLTTLQKFLKECNDNSGSGDEDDDGSNKKRKKPQRSEESVKKPKVDVVAPVVTPVKQASPQVSSSSSSSSSREEDDDEEEEEVKGPRVPLPTALVTNGMVSKPVITTTPVTTTTTPTLPPPRSNADILASKKASMLAMWGEGKKQATKSS